MDDILVTGSNNHELKALLDQLNQAFALKDLGTVNYFLGIQVQPTSEGLHLSQKKYITVLLCEVRMQYAKAIST